MTERPEEVPREEVEALLRDSAADCREILAEAADETDVPGLHAAEQLLAAQVASARAARTRRWVLGGGLLAAAAAVVLWVAIDGARGDGTEPREPFFLGPDDPPILLHPVEEVTAYTPLEWEGLTSDGVQLTLELFDATTDALLPLGGPFYPDASPWTPPDSVHFGSVEKLLWTLTATGTDGYSVTSVAEAWRSSR